MPKVFDLITSTGGKLKNLNDTQMTLKKIIQAIRLIENY